MKKAWVLALAIFAVGCVPRDYEKPDYLTGNLLKSEVTNGKLYCFYKIIDLENNVIFSTVPAAPNKPCTKNVKINMENDEIIWLK